MNFITQELYSMESVIRKSCACAIKTLSNWDKVPLDWGEWQHTLAALPQGIKPQHPLTINNGDIGGWDSIVGIVTCYGLDSSGFKPQWGHKIFSSPHTFRQELGPVSLLYNGYRGSLLGAKWPRHGIDHPSSSAEIKNKYGCTSMPPLGMHDMLQWDLYLMSSVHLNLFSWEYLPINPRLSQWYPLLH